MDKLGEVEGEIPLSEQDALRLRDNVKKVIDSLTIKSRGFNTIVNSITHILDSSKMGYQSIQNFKNKRSCIISEYSQEKSDELPDEHYSIHINYYDHSQIQEMRKAYRLQHAELVRTVEEAETVVYKVLEKAKKFLGFRTYEDLLKQLPDEKRQEESKLWNELTFIQPKPSEMKSKHNNFTGENEFGKKKIERMRQLIPLIFKKRYTEEREIIEKRVEFLEDHFNLFSSKVNPFHIQPGIVLTINVSTVKRKKSTLYSIANVLNEFLNAVSRGFSDKAFAQFSRQRNTIREDFSGEFVSVEGAGRKNEQTESVPA